MLACALLRGFGINTLRVSPEVSVIIRFVSSRNNVTATFTPCGLLLVTLCMLACRLLLYRGMDMLRVSRVSVGMIIAVV